MRQIHVAKRLPRPASWPQTPLPPDPRDPDIVRAHQITRRAASPAPGPGPTPAAGSDLPGSPRPPA